MKYILLLAILLSGCRIDITVESLYNYDFSNNIVVSNIDDAAKYIACIPYKRDAWEYWQTPEETYLLQTGDCEDHAIMFAYLCDRLEINNINVVIVRTTTGEYHAINYIDNNFYDPLVYAHCTSDDTIYHAYPLTAEDLEEYEIIYVIPYAEAIWMAVNWHSAVGEYEL